MNLLHPVISFITVRQLYPLYNSALCFITVVDGLPYTEEEILVSC